MSRTGLSWQAAVRWQFEADWTPRGIALAAETGSLLAWDELDTLYHLAADGSLLAARLGRDPCLTAAISADGHTIVSVTGGELIWFDRLLVERFRAPLPPDCCAVSLDATGWYAAVSTTAGELLVIDCHNQRVARSALSEAFVALQFPLQSDLLLGLSCSGWLAAFRLDGELVWQQRLDSEGFDLAISSADGMVAVAGGDETIARFDLRGKRRPAVAVSGAIRVEVSQPGDVLLATNKQGEVLLVRADGTLLWKHLPALPPIGAALDSLGRACWIASPERSIECLQLQGTWRAPARPPGGTPWIEPTWQVALEDVDVEAAPPMLAVASDPLRIGVVDGRQRLRVYRRRGHSKDGKLTFVGPALRDPPVALVASQGALVVRCEQGLLHYQSASKSASRLPSPGGRILQCIPWDDRHLFCATAQQQVALLGADRTVHWTRQLGAAVEAMSVSDRLVAVAQTDGQLVLIDPQGTLLATRSIGSPPPYYLACSSEGVTLLSDDATARFYSLDGTPRWNLNLPLQPMSARQVGSRLIAGDALGRWCGIDPTGAILESSCSPQVAQAACFELPRGRLGQAFDRDNCFCWTEFAGSMLARYRHPEPLLAAVGSVRGVAAIFGDRLCWFDHRRLLAGC